MTLLHVRQERVYYDATDAMGIVYHANYLAFMERARSDWLRLFVAQHKAQLGVSSSGLAESASDEINIDDAALHHQEWPLFVVTQVNSRFRSPARLDDQLLVTVEIEKIRPASMVFTQRVLAVSDADSKGWEGKGKPPALSGRLHCEAEVRIGCVDAKSLAPTRPPPSMRQAFDTLQTNL